MTEYDPRLYRSVEVSARTVVQMAASLNGNHPDTLELAVATQECNLEALCTSVGANPYDYLEAFNKLIIKVYKA